MKERENSNNPKNRESRSRMNGESLKRKQAKSRLRICKMKVKKTAATTKMTLLT